MAQEEEQDPRALPMSRSAPCMAASPSVYECVNMTSVVKSFEWSVGWKIAIEMQAWV